MSCANPIDGATLVDYWAGDMDDDAAVVLEEHLFGCADCSAASARVGAVTEAVRASIPSVVLRERIDRLRATGARVRENGFAPGDRREVEFAADVDLLIHRLGGLDLQGAARVDLWVTSESTGETVGSVDNVPFDAAEGAVFVACQRHYAALPHDTVMTVSVHAPGAPPRTARYTILHRYL
jgi:anti-sigma factor RsiW